MSGNKVNNNFKNHYFLNVDDCIHYNDVSSQSINLKMKHLNIIQFNIHSMNDLSKFDNFLEIVDMFSGNIHIIVLTETWVKSTSIQFFNISKYSSVFSCRDDRIGGGIAMYVRSDLVYSTVSTDGGVYDFQFIQIELINFNTRVCAIYRPPDSDIAQFFIRLDVLLSSNCSNRLDNILVGDLNIPINKNTNNSKNYFNLLSNLGMVLTNTIETRSASGNIVDHVASSFTNINCISNQTIYCQISDHNIIFSKFKYRDKFIVKKIEKRKIDYTKVNEMFTAYLNDLIVNNEEPNKILLSIIAKYKELVSKFTRVEYINAKVKSTNCPWINYSILKLTRQKNNVLKRLKKSNNSMNILLKDLLRDKLDRISKAICIEKYWAKKRYFHNKFSDVTTLKELWKNINSILGITKSVGDNVEIRVNGAVICSSKKVADIFNKFFAECGSTISSSLNSDANFNKFNTVKSISSSIYLKPTSPAELFNLINELGNNKGCGLDFITAETLKKNIDVFSILLSSVFNRIILTGIYPDCLKVSKVFPVFKNGDKLDVNNYRPISILSVFDKLLEKVLNSRIIDFLIKNNFFYRYQYGFRSGVGTEVALIETVDMIYEGLNDQLYVGALFLDLRKAFDCMDHGILLDKLAQYGFRGTMYNLFKSYLTNRIQYVSINEVLSDPRCIVSGVPQGSVLGPTLFLIFINDICHLKLNGSIRLFADDTSLFYKTSDVEDLSVMVQSDLSILNQYFNCNMLSLNLTKSKFMIFKSAQKKIDISINIRISSIDIETVDTYKYLGIMFDSNLSWQSHIDYLCKKLAALVGYMRKLSYYVPVSILRNIYFAFIHSRLAYGIGVYGLAARSRLVKLQTQQNKALKAVYKLPYLFSTLELYSNVAKGILPLLALNNIHIVSYVHKVVTSTSNLYNIEFLVPVHTYRTRYSNNLCKVNFNNDYGRRRMSYIGPHNYNKLPDSIKSLRNELKFKIAIKEYCHLNISQFTI